MNRISVERLYKWLDQYLNFERTPKKNIFWLDTMNFLCDQFGHPEKSAPCIHVAGSKGKGSISKMTASILNEAGYKTGLYGSPHIIDFRERIMTADGFLDEEIYEKCGAELINRINSLDIKQYPGERPVTWFELVTLYSFLCFKTAHTDWNVFEVGLGGRLDATNVVNPECCIIGPIELEHTAYLGDTLEKIAFEKAGIMKPGVPVIIAPQPNDCVNKVFEQTANERKSPIFFTDNEMEISDIVYDLTFEQKNASEMSKNKGHTNGSFKLTNVMSFNLQEKNSAEKMKIAMNMPGDFQCQNAASSVLALTKILPAIEKKNIVNGLSKAFLPGRFEIIQNPHKYKKVPYVILDGAHTVNSIRFTMNTFDRLFAEKYSSGSRPVLLFACASDKDVEDIVPLFEGHFDFIFLTKPGEKKQADLARAKSAFEKNNLLYEFYTDYRKAIKDSLKIAAFNDVPLLVTGSFYLLAEVKKIIQ